MSLFTTSIQKLPNALTRVFSSGTATVIALGISILSLWNSSCSPANVKVLMNSPVWLPRAAPPGKIGGVGLKLACIFTNGGAETGVIEDLVLRIEGNSGELPELFAPFMVIDEAKFFLAPTPDINYIKGPFYPVVVQGRQSLVLSLLFGPWKPPPITSPPRSDHCKMTLLTRSAGSRHFEQQQTWTGMPCPWQFGATPGPMLQVVPPEIETPRGELSK